MSYSPMHCTNHFGISLEQRAAWVAEEQANLVRWTAEWQAMDPAAERYEPLRATIQGHAYALFESERKRSADLAFQANVSEHWSWNQEPYRDHREVLDAQVAERAINEALMDAQEAVEAVRPLLKKVGAPGMWDDLRCAVRTVEGMRAWSEANRGWTVAEV